MGTSYKVFFVGLASELHRVHSCHSIKTSRGRRQGWEWKIGVLFYLEKKSRTRCSSISLSFFSLTVSLLLSMSQGESEMGRPLPAPYCITHYNDCCSGSVVPNQSYWTLFVFQGNVWSLLEKSDKISVVSVEDWCKILSGRACDLPPMLQEYSNSVMFSAWHLCS